MDQGLSGLATGAFPGNADMRHFRLAQASWKLCYHTWRDRKSTIVLTLFKTSTKSCCADATLSSTSNMCGIDGEVTVESRLQSWQTIRSQLLGRCPHAAMTPRLWR